MHESILMKRSLESAKERDHSEKQGADEKIKLMSV